MENGSTVYEEMMKLKEVVRLIRKESQNMTFGQI